MAVTFERGILHSTTDAGQSNFLWTKSGFAIKAQSVTQTTPKGNTKTKEYFDHVAEIKISAQFALEDTLPVPGDTITLTGLTLPTISEAGVKTGDLQITGELSDTAKFKVSDVSTSAAPKDYQSVDITAERFIQQGVPA